MRAHNALCAMKTDCARSQRFMRDEINIYSITAIYQRSENYFPLQEIRICFRVFF